MFFFSLALINFDQTLSCNEFCVWFVCMATIDDDDDNESESFFFGEKKMIRQKIYRNDILSL